MSEHLKIVVPGYEGRAAQVAAGSRIRITDLEGCQIGDLFVMAKADVAEAVSPAVTRLETFNLFPRVGQQFFSTRHRLMLSFLEDTSPGCHDMSFAPCDREFYQALGCDAPHPNCRDNFFHALRDIGLQRDSPPDPLNLFQNTVPDERGEYVAGVSPSVAGDHVEFRAEMDLVIVLTACSADLDIQGKAPIGGRSTSLGIDVFGVS